VEQLSTTPCEAFVALPAPSKPPAGLDDSEQVFDAEVALLQSEESTVDMTPIDHADAEGDAVESEEAMSPPSFTAACHELLIEIVAADEGIEADAEVSALVETPAGDDLRTQPTASDEAGSGQRCDAIDPDAPPSSAGPCDAPRAEVAVSVDEEGMVAGEAIPSPSEPEGHEPRSEPAISDQESLASDRAEGANDLAAAVAVVSRSHLLRSASDIGGIGGPNGFVLQDEKKGPRSELHEIVKTPDFRSVNIGGIDDAGRHARMPRAAKWRANSGEGMYHHAICTESDVRVAARRKWTPALGSANAIRRAEAEGTTCDLIKEHVPRPGPEIRYAPHGRTNIPPKSIESVVIYQPQTFDPSALAGEIVRVGKPGAHVTLAGVFYGSIGDETFDRQLFDTINNVSPLYSAGERHLLTEFARFPLKLENASVMLRNKNVRRQYATADWTFYDLLAFLRTFAGVQRAERYCARGDGMPWAKRFNVWRDFELLAAAWGNPKKSRRIRWPVFGRTGFLPR